MLHYQNFLSNLTFETQLINDVKKLIYNKVLLIGDKPLAKNVWAMFPENQDREVVVVQIRNGKPIDKHHDHRLTKACSGEGDEILVIYDHDHGDVKLSFIAAKNLQLGFCHLLLLAYYSSTADEAFTDVRLVNVSNENHGQLHYSNQPTANLFDIDEVQEEFANLK